MIDYHFTSKLALYRAIVRDMLGATGQALCAVAESPTSATDRLARFIAAFVELADTRPGFHR